eukprot:TRINITY_DN505_c0_g1_i3.p1 TRINITY_DN505_c0_g1~~TRINITY_DN505_c0_g1_i3.p1  ORF type:complete len:217 (-),score=41.31 TRINITY_DN505_c0_g1_i3:41-691(-)
MMETLSQQSLQKNINSKQSKTDSNTMTIPPSALASQPKKQAISEFDTKHPLQYSWSWWYDNGDTKTASYGSNLKKIYTFSTVEDFWCLWNNIKSASELSLGSNYHVFKEGIRPLWEDPANSAGGRWIIQLKNPQLNQLWMYTVLACIGNVFEDEEEVCGIVVSIRNRGHKVALWTKTTNEERMMRIGQHLKKILGWQDKIEYQVHSCAYQIKYMVQ